MSFSRRLGVGFAAPTLALMAVLVLLAWLTRWPGFYADKLLLAATAAALVWLLWARTWRTNRLVARYVAALEHGDLAQAFRTRGQGAGLDELGAAFDDALRRLRAERHRAAAENRFAAALVDEAPAPLLTVSAGGVVQLANKAARKLFREADGLPLDAFRRYGGEFALALAEAGPGERRLCRVRWNGLMQQALVTVALADREGVPTRIVSVQIIQRELDAATMETQTDLVRVLTHEIMNSLTPVTSLAASARRLLEDADGDAAELVDARDAVRALSERADAITRFVEAYRSFTDAPAITIRTFAAEPWLRNLALAFMATPQARGVTLEQSIADGLGIEADANLLGQVVLNLLKNAGQACAAVDRPAVRLEALRGEDGRIRIRVSDNGPGVPAGLEGEIFLPFFTTKQDGTGVGLSFAKQVVLLHGGTIGLASAELGGATFQILL